MLAELVEPSPRTRSASLTTRELRAFPCSSRGGRGWPISPPRDGRGRALPDRDRRLPDGRASLAALVPSTAQFGDGARVIVSARRPTAPRACSRSSTIRQRRRPGRRRRAPRRHGRGQPDHRRGLPRARGTPRPRRLQGRVSGRVPDLRQRLPRLRPLHHRRARRAAARARRGLGRRPRPRVRARPVRDRDRGADTADYRAAAARARGRAESVAPARRLRPQARRGDRAAAAVQADAVVTDQYAAPAVIDRLQDAGFLVEAVHLSAQNKTAGVRRAARAPLRRHVRAVPARRPGRRAASAAHAVHRGQAAVENPRVGGSHGDLAKALALAVHHIGQHGTGEVAWVNPRELTPVAARGVPSPECSPRR